VGKHSDSEGVNRHTRRYILVRSLINMKSVGRNLKMQETCIDTKGYILSLVRSLINVMFVRKHSDSQEH
jgi:hypothetical protein